MDKNFYLDLYNHSATALYFEKAILKAINDAVDQKSVKQALAKQVMHTFSKRAELPLDYTNQVNSTIASISVRAGDYTALFNKLKAMGALSDEQINSYNTKLNLLEKYASAKGATTGTIPSYSFINVENDNLPSTVSKTFAMDSVYPEMKANDNKENKYVATSVRVTNIRSQGAQNVAVAPSVNSISEPTSIQFQLQFTPNYGVNTVEFDVEIGNEKIPMQYTFFYDNNKANTAFVKENLSSTRK
ncbi:yhgE/Pip domain protein [Streptococcus intermedius]|uniref:yhgE/Pip domain protein n=1 Tax=Streptococcus intermedius TaxID=1338 RepID=UPI0002D262E6|nr:yhgE/Pip domain protein [Streptococcus intermedius]ALF27095.1 yhgE/Pip domain protein [Streptococcus intermedius]ARC26531.1 yhgE/Pip domain protein [Streptococcus intermedius]